LAEVKATGGVRIVDPAVVPAVPVEPRPLFNTLIAAMVGLLLSIAVIVVIEYLDDTVKTTEDLERATALPTLGVVGVMPSSSHNGSKNGIGNGNGKSLIVSNPRLHFGEAYRTLRTNIQFATLNRPGQVLMVTSALQGEGKSFTLANLAVVIAQTGKSVLVVDSDVRRPTQHKHFHVANDVGLTDLLLSNNLSLANVGPYIKQTEYPGLCLMTSGPTPPNPSELLSSPQMVRLVEVLRKQADVVLFDSPPALVVADSSILSALVDGVLLVVEQGRNRSDAIVRMRENLSRPGATILGAVLNRFKVGTEGYYYSYYRKGYQAEETPLVRSVNGVGS
jgi:non-specific protein-tyrosine kinase